VFDLEALLEVVEGEGLVVLVVGRDVLLLLRYLVLYLVVVVNIGIIGYAY
jgi:hypothetical protein